MVVEDNEINRVVLDSTLKRFNLNVAIVENGYDAVEYLKTNVNIDLILMDLHMPYMDGFHATESIRRELKLDIPIVVLTASSVVTEREKSFEVGANDFLNKPFTSEQLGECLDRFLSNQNSTSQKQDLSSAPEAYDLSTLYQMEDADIIKSIHDLFEELVPANLQELKQSAKEQRWDDINFKAHKLKSSLGVIQIKSVYDHLCSIELLAKQKQEPERILTMIEESIITYNTLAPLIRSNIQKEINRLLN